METPSKKSVGVTLLNLLISALVSGIGSFTNIPLGVIADLTFIFICIAILGAVIGTILALQSFKPFLALGIDFCSYRGRRAHRVFIPAWAWWFISVSGISSGLSFLLYLSRFLFPLYLP